MFDQDVFDAGFADIVTQIDSLVSGLLVVPAGTLFLEANDEIHYLP